MLYTAVIFSCLLQLHFTEKKSEACRKYASLKSELEAYNEHAHKPSTMGLRRRRSYALFKDKEDKGVAHTRKLHDLKLAFSEFYLSLILLQNYQMLNFTGFRKILKKHDKVTSDVYDSIFLIRQSVM